MCLVVFFASEHWLFVDVGLLSHVVAERGDTEVEYGFSGDVWDITPLSPVDLTRAAVSDSVFSFRLPRRRGKRR